MSKKIIIISSVAIGIIALIVTLMLTLFTVKNVSFSSLNQNNFDTSIIHVDTGKNVFFLNKKDIVEDIEKNHPFIDVINIETVFPNSLVVHYALREETFAIKDYDQDKVYIVDDQLVVLRILNISTYKSTQSNAILVENLNVINNCKTGEILQISYYNDANSQEYMQNLFMQISDSFILCSRDVSEQCALIKKIFIEYNAIHNLTDNDGFVLNMYTFDDYLIKIYNPVIKLQTKIQCCLSVLPECLPEHIATSYLEIYEDNNGQVVAKRSLKS